MTSQIVKSLIVRQDAATLYRLWADFQYFPHFMKYVKAVHKVDESISRWEVAGPMGQTVNWQAEITRREPDKRIAWNSKDLEGTVTTSGQVTFNNLSPDETEVTVTMNYTPPGGKVGEVIGNLFANPEKRIEEDLGHFKKFAEQMYDRLEVK